MPAASATALLAPQSSPTSASPARFLRVEALALFVVAVLAYRWVLATLPGAYGWGVFAAGFLLPDLAMLGYLRSPRAGAAAYNLAHTETVPVLLLGAAWYTQNVPLMSVALLWLAHIGFDRAAGYGLKFADAFGHTHLGRVGRNA